MKNQFGPDLETAPADESVSRTADWQVAGAGQGNRLYIAGILTLAMTVSFADRYVLAMLIQPIKADLQLSDTQIGLVTGFAFSAFYAVFGLIVARLSDRGLHRSVILASLAVWSVMTALCGLALNFLHLLLARFGVGAGEAGVAPASHAVLANLFPPERRTTALAVFSAGGPLGILIAFAVSGPLEVAVGWRATFFIMGIPGLVLALLFAFTIPVLPSLPVRQGSETLNGGPGGVWRLLSNPRFLSLLTTVSLVNLMSFGLPQWLPAFFERSHGISRAQLGPALALTQGLGMLIGMSLGGPIADRMARRHERWRMRFVMFSIVAGLPFAIGMFLTDNMLNALVCAGLSAFLFGAVGGPLWSAVQDIAPPQGRATAAALVMMAASFLGMGCGPLLIGIFSDLLAGNYGDASLAQALIIVSTGGGFLLLLSLRLTIRMMQTRLAVAS